MRIVRNPLVWAKRCERPACIRKGRVRGVKALGIRYENLVARRMPWATQGQWFEFADGEGHGWCQVDLLWDQGDFVVIGEVKYSWVNEAAEKLRWLYKPIVERVLGKPTVEVVVCKYLKPGVRHVYGDLEGAIGFGLKARWNVPTLHWIGQGAIVNPMDHGPILTRRLPGGQARHIET